MRSIRRWAYDTFGREDVFTFIQMTTNEDIHANAEYVHMADMLEVPGLILMLSTSSLIPKLTATSYYVLFSDCGRGPKFQQLCQRSRDCSLRTETLC